MQNGCWQNQFCVSRIFLVNWEFSFRNRFTRFSLTKQKHFGDFHDFKQIFMKSSTLFLTKSTFSYQKAQKTKVAQNHAKQFLVGPILCYAYNLANCEFSFPNWLIKLSKRKLWNFGICGSLPALHAICRVDLLNPTHNGPNIYAKHKIGSTNIRFR